MPKRKFSCDNPLHQDIDYGVSPCPVCSLLNTLHAIERGAGPYSLDPLTHAENCIEDMKAEAARAIAEAREKADAEA